MTKSDSPAAPVLGAFSPTRLRIFGALSLAIGAFFLPQEVPLVWYPLNDPGEDILYLELKCASNQDGDVKLYLNTTRGINELNTIYFPISPTEQTFTYTFPLFDAPITEIRLDPVAQGGTLTIDHLRIIDRRGVEYRRFTVDMLRDAAEISAITPTKEGWSITSTPESFDPRVMIELVSPIVAKGIDQRSVLRCLLSTSYLSLMLWILLLAVLFVFWRPSSWRDFFLHLGFMASLAVMFAFVGNRGLIKNSWHYAQFVAAELADEIRLELDLVSSGPTGSQLFWNDGDGFNETDSQMITLASHDGLQTARFRLPTEEIRALRLDPRHNGGDIVVRGMRVVDWGNRTHAVLPLDSLLPQQHIDEISAGPDALLITTTPGEDDPITRFRPEAVEAINAAIDGRLTRFAH